jgi:large subunit ribosomal protein L31
MQAAIHPKTYEATITCTSCGFTFTADSTKESYHIEVCSKCHPFYTGKQRFLDTKGNVDRFKRKQEQAKKYSQEIAAKKKKEQTKKEKPTKSLKELLGDL